MPHSHSVYDTDAHFSINPITRAIKNETPQKVVLIQHDHNSERFTFKIPRLVDGHDMSLCNRVEIHFNNVDAKTKEDHPDVYEVDDLRVSPDDANSVLCSWLISRNATQHVGVLGFLLRFACVEAGVVTYDWHTLTHTGISVSAGMNNGEAAVAEYTEILEQWREKLFGLYESEQTKIQAAGAKQVAAVEAEATRVLATIPEDYTALSARAVRNSDSKALAILDTTSKAASAELYAQEGPLAVTLYGNSAGVGYNRKITLGGSESWTLVSTGTHAYAFQGYVLQGYDFAHDGGYMNMWTNRLPTISKSENDDAGWAWVRGTTYSENIIYIFFSLDSGISTEAKLRAWLAEHPLEVWYRATTGDGSVYGVMATEGSDEFVGVAAETDAPLYGDDALGVYDTIENWAPSGCDKRVVLDGSEGWIKASGADNDGNFIFYILNFAAPNSRAYSDRFPYNAANAAKAGLFINEHGALLLNVGEYGTASEFNAALAANPLTVFYRSTAYKSADDLKVMKTTRRWEMTDGQVLQQLATPEIYMDDPVRLDSLGAMPEIVTGSGEISVEYPHDTKHYIDTKLAALTGE